MAERFFIEKPPTDGQITLEGDQAHHLGRVMRAKPGTPVVLFDGAGKEFSAIVEEVAKRQVRLRVESQQSLPDPNQPAIAVAVALPKGDRQKFLVEKLVELGANHLIPLKTQRSVAAAGPKVLERIGKQVIEASKQCRRGWLMEVESEKTVSQLASQWQDWARLIADPYSQQSLSGGSAVGTIVAVGPEGGFTDDEIEVLLTAGWAKACFSPNVLRVETAATAAVAILRSGSSFTRLDG